VTSWREALAALKAELSVHVAEKQAWLEDMGRMMSEEREMYRRNEELHKTVATLQAQLAATSAEKVLMEKEIALLTDQNTQLVGHQNPKQKIHLHAKVKEENVLLKKERSKLANDNQTLQKIIGLLQNESVRSVPAPADRENKENAQFNISEVLFWRLQTELPDGILHRQGGGGGQSL
jgi:hypothetical protein